MAIAYIEPGQVFELDGALYRIDREVGDKEWQSVRISSGRYVVHTTEFLHKRLIDKRLKFIVSDKYENKMIAREMNNAIDLLPAKKRKIAEMRLVYVKAVISAQPGIYTKRSLDPIINEVFKKRNFDGSKPNWSTVNRWRKRYLNGGSDIRSLVDRDSNKGKWNRYDEIMYELVDKAINEIYMKPERASVEDTRDRAITLIKEENKKRIDKLPLPTKTFVKNRITKIPEFDRYFARYGRYAAIKKFRSVIGSIFAERPLERVEIDHTQLNIMLVDDIHMLPLGRPYLTACIDVASRSFLGIYVGFEPPSFLTVSQCLKHAILPKVNIKEKFCELKGEWLQYGIMELLAVDNGFEFHGTDIKVVADSFGVTIAFMPHRTPWYKPYIERGIATLNRGTTNGLPGTTFENILEKEDYDAAKNATIKLSTFLHIVHIWIVDYYHKKQHSALGMSPNEFWIEHESKIPIPLPADVDDLDSLLGSVDTRVVSHKGVEINSLFYNSDELTKLRLKLGDTFKATIRYNKADLGHIYVIDQDTGKALLVPAVNSEYAKGLSLWQHNVCKNYARKNLNRYDIEGLAEAKDTIRKLIVQDYSDKRIKTRVRSTRFNNSVVPMTNDSEGKQVPKQHEYKYVNNDAVSFTTVGHDAISGDYAGKSRIDTPCEAKPSTKRTLKTIID